MDALIIYSNYSHPMINGSIINALEYYFAIREYNKKIHLLFVNFTEDHKRHIIETIGTRFEGLPEGSCSNIFFIERREVLTKSFDRILVLDYSTMRDLKGLVNSKEYTIISERYTHEKKFFWNYPGKKIKYFNEMPFEYGDERYKMKMLFEYYPKISSSSDAIFISSPDLGIQKVENRSAIETKLIERICRADKDILFKAPLHSQDLFSTFSELYYIKILNSWDCHPRLMHEATFYGKEVNYINDAGLKDGSYYRFRDLQESGLSGRSFLKTDPIIERFL